MDGVSPALITIDQVVEGLLRPLLAKLVLSDLDLMFDFVTPIFSLLPTIKGLANGSIAILTNDCSPGVSLSSLRISFKNRCHSSNLMFKVRAVGAKGVLAN